MGNFFKKKGTRKLLFFFLYKEEKDPCGEFLNQGSGAGALGIKAKYTKIPKIPFHV